MGLDTYTPCPGCGYYIKVHDEAHAPGCPEIDTTDYTQCVQECPHDYGHCQGLDACWGEGLTMRYVRHGVVAREDQPVDLKALGVTRG